MGIISWIILGLIAGFIGSKIVDKQGQGFWLDIALGIIGALVGGFLFSLFGATGVTGLNIWSMVVAIIGAIVVLLIYNAVTGRRALRSGPSAALKETGEGARPIPHSARTFSPR